MFNAEKLLGGLIRSSTRGSRGGLGSLLTGGMAMGALGVAMEAVDHYMNTPRAGGMSPPASGRPPAMPGTMPPPSPPPGSTAAGPPPPPKAAATTGDETDAVLLIRAMIAAANADGVIDQAERDRILQRLQAIDLSPEEQAFITRELLSPADLDTIVAGIDSPALARQVYTVSLMAIEVDTPQEANYMATLAERLGLDPATVDQINRSLGLE